MHWTVGRAIHVVQVVKKVLHSLHPSLANGENQLRAAINSVDKEGKGYLATAQLQVRPWISDLAFLRFGVFAVEKPSPDDQQV